MTEFAPGHIFLARSEKDPSDFRSKISVTYCTCGWVSPQVVPEYNSVASRLDRERCAEHEREVLTALGIKHRIVRGDGRIGQYAYTSGLDTELVVSGWRDDIQRNLINEFANRTDVRHGLRGSCEVGEFVLMDVSEANLDLLPERVGQRALQFVFGDSAGNFPWHPNYWKGDRILLISAQDPFAPCPGCPGGGDGPWHNSCRNYELSGRDSE